MEAKMARRHAEEAETEAPATESYILGQDVNVAGVDCRKGGKLELTAEQAEAMKAAGVRFEGDEEKTPEELQKAHEEAVDAQKKEIEARRKEEAKHEASEEAHQSGEEFDEAEWSADYDRQQKVTNEEYEPPAERPTESP